MIASHNSWTFGTPKKWWQKIINFTSKCQSLNIQEQYNKGVRLFDLRLAGNKVFHGLVEYNVDYLSDLFWLNGKKDVSVRILLEKDGYEESFKSIVDILISTYPDIKFYGGQRKSDWKKLSNLPDIGIIDKYSSTTTLFPCFKSKVFAVLDDWWPWLYSYITKDLRKGWKEEYKDTWLMLDFI